LTNDIRSSFIVHRSSFIVHHSSFIVHHSPMTMTQQESLALVRQLLGAKDDDELTQIIGLNLGRIDGTFFGVLNASVKQLEREGKPTIAAALQDLGDRMLRMKTLI
jgi:hypothetical protein